MNQAVMVVDANALAMIAAIRSLGRAGYRPHAVSPKHDALGFRSSYTFKHSVHPDYDSTDFIPWVRSYVAENAIRAIVCGEAFLEAIERDYDEFEALIPDSPSPEVRKLCLSKVRVWNHLLGSERTRAALPESGVLREQKCIESFAATHSQDAVYYLKTDAEYRRAPGASSRVARVQGVEDMRRVAANALEDFTAAFWQREVRGLQVGVSLWRHEGRIIAENMVLGLHLYPYYAGNMSLRRTWWHERLLRDAKIKLEALNWSGVAMMEYIWNPDTDQFWFIEMNPRYWGYLHLDLSCGKDFPRWQLDAHFGQVTQSLGVPVPARTLRYAPGEVLHVASRWLGGDIPVVDKFKSLGGFVLLGLNPKIKADLWFTGDRLLYWRAWLRFLYELPGRVGRILHRRAKR